MQRYGATLVYRGRDEYGDIEVVQNDRERSLHFGTAAKQSAMLLADPHALALSYTRAMATALLFIEPPRRALVIGLGGGSLVKFLLRHFPLCRVDVVELREQVARLAHDWFEVPADERLTVTLADARTFALDADPQRHGDYDLVLVDAFVAHGISDRVCGPTFFEAVGRRMAPGAGLAMNLWSGDQVSVEQVMETIEVALDAAVLKLPLAGRDNVVALSVARPGLRRLLPRLADKARGLELALGVEFPVLWRRLRKENVL